MRFSFLLICIFFIIGGCTEVLRKPNFYLANVENPDDDFSYEVTGYDVTPAIISKANSSPFVRYVNFGSDGVSSVRRVKESALFSGPKPLANKRPDYVIGIGDTLAISRSGNTLNKDGVKTLQAVNNSYQVSEQGSIELLEGTSVVVEGLTIDQARLAVQSALGSTAGKARMPFTEFEFPVSEPPVYRLGAGDVIRVSRLIESANDRGDLVQTVQTSQNIVGSNGIVSILQLGELEVAGLTLPQVRDLVLQEAIRNAGGIDTVVEIQNFVSQSALVVGDLETRIIPITDQRLTYDRLIAQLNLPFDGDRDYQVKLERDRHEYQMSAKSILTARRDRTYHVFDGDRITISEIFPESDVRLNVADFGARTLTYLRVTNGSPTSIQQGTSVPFDLRGIDLRGLLIAQGINVNQNEDLLIRLNRGKNTFSLSAQSVVLKNPSRRYWLAPDDHVVVEDIAYVGENALLVGEVGLPRQLAINRHNRTTLSQALFDSGAFSAGSADFRHIYILRGEGYKYDAFHFDITQLLNLGLAEDFELRPGDIMFVRTRPLTRYTSALAIALGFVNVIDKGITNAKTFGR